MTDVHDPQRLPPAPEVEAEAGPVLARLRPAPAQRAIGVGFLLAVGGFFAWAAVSRSPDFDLGTWQPLLVLPAAAAVWVGVRLARATGGGLELTPVALRDTSGRVVAAVEEIRSVDRGTFAFKPSGGFVLHLAARRGAAWQPGLWWRFGTRVGVGGVTSRVEARYMADAIALLIAGRGG